MKYQAYPKYKDSSVEWLGDIPEEWNVLDLKFGSQIELSNIDKHSVEGETDVYLCNYTDVYNNEVIASSLPFMKATATNEQIKRLLLQEGDVIITKDSESPDDIGIAAFVQEISTNLVCGYHLCLIRPQKDKFSGRYLFWFFEAKSTQAYYFVEAVGMTRYALGKYSIANTQVPFPSLKTQQSIAFFLNNETTKIDGLIAEYKELIALLQEKRHALISHAVTRGLSELVKPDDPKFGEWKKTVRFVESGIEWLGEIPEGWEVKKIERLYREVSEEGHDDLPILSVSIHTGVSDKELGADELERKVTRSDDREKYKRVAPNDLTYNMMRAWQGGFGAVAVEGMVSPAYVVARPTLDIVSGYFEMILRTPNAVEEMRIHSRGVTDFRLRLYWEEFRVISVPNPSKAEQKAIMDYLDRENDKSVKLMNEMEGAIDLLKEHRSALITAVVTGKISVEGRA